MKDHAGIKGHICFVLERADGTKEVTEWENLITDAGDLHMAEMLVGQATPTKAFWSNGKLVLAETGTPTAAAKDDDYSDMAGIISSSIKSPDTGYPRVDDPDPDNTGRGEDVATIRVRYLTSEANTAAAGIDQLALVVDGASGTDAIFNRATTTDGDFTARTKSSSDTLKVFYNVTITGA